MSLAVASRAACSITLIRYHCGLRQCFVSLGFTREETSMPQLASPPSPHTSKIQHTWASSKNNCGTLWHAVAQFAGGKHHHPVPFLAYHSLRRYAISSRASVGGSQNITHSAGTRRCALFTVPHRPTTPLALAA
jgi:hypothetical protein